ncbi:hypothetical protein BUALT_Bualt04G0174400 [Buddleja alternifolia]|uniref:Uncharacterized protein n=1 Tax=Buddleja alternifolia TaxID=168488 RepID=A0AAV6XR83_9LAMI|nr:hypothetical protein BUALT_Bualt04G0174400 [Buddleja alternifolia]
MNDYAGLMIATALFAFLCPGLVFQLPGKHRPVDFLNFKTSIPSMVLHALKEQTRLQEYEEYNSDKHWAPVRH